MKLSINIPKEELEKAEEIFKQLGTTTDSAVEWFIKTTIQEQRLTAIPKKIKRNTKPIKLTIDRDGMLRLPEDAPKEAKDWVERG
ncbi:hypothetical protein [Enterococcus sp. CWB-B31]|uniref:hypothetical protein n=1 Tax=Enterococcus sp. CWB-B31 TaxID=2885159 RepID=UPI001E5F9417|nr:hypothetical protein [Enterococcus sp. CWB-B31]MCB5955576.1 hypothetical protein [Enterococcus sp. CWB-B31]